MRGQSGVGVDDDASGVASGDAPDGQLRVIGNGCADPDHHRVDQRPQTMQMAQATFAVDVIGVSAGSGDAGVDGLSALPDHDEIVDHTSSTILDSVTEPVDLLLNLAPISPEDFAALVPLVRDGGIVVATTAWMTTPGDESRGVRTAGVFVEPKVDELEQLVALVDGGELTVNVAQRVPLSELPGIHANAAAGELRGKVVAVPEAR